VRTVRPKFRECLSDAKTLAAKSDVFLAAHSVIYGLKRKLCFCPREWVEAASKISSPSCATELLDCRQISVCTDGAGWPVGHNHLCEHPHRPAEQRFCMLRKLKKEKEKKKIIEVHLSKLPLSPLLTHRKFAVQ